MTSKPTDKPETGAWNPQIRSALPSEYLPLSTIFRPENVATEINTANELADFTGLALQQLVEFLPQRLVTHELLIRVSADIFVTDGSRYEDLGVNFRCIVSHILAQYINPEMSSVIDRFNRAKEQAEAMISAELNATLGGGGQKSGDSKTTPGSLLCRMFARKPKKAAQQNSDSIAQREKAWLAAWGAKAESSNDSLAAAVYRSLVKVARSILARHGRLRGDQSLLTSLALVQFSNGYGSEVIGDAIAPMVNAAIDQEGYLRLPAQKKPVVFNVKGASASGKSTMRPKLHEQADKLGLRWEEFALISPDIWRKYLLDYDSLGDAYKYAGTLAGDEIPIIDKKLDRYIERKATAGRVSHLLIDRFRFDSFAAGRDSEEGSNLLTRFGDTIHLIFMVTPPEATVERAWVRGLQVGRYKAVDDLLDHNIEAFKGIPVLFFTWALRHDKKVFFEFLDNSVTKGKTPETIAFGLNGEMYLLDFKCMIDIMRYSKINIDACSPAEVYLRTENFAAADNTDFLSNCARQLPVINFVDRKTEQIYARMEAGTLCWADTGFIRSLLDDADTFAGFQAIAPGLISDPHSVNDQPRQPIPDSARQQVIGALGV